jgi:hypothetical protein
MDEPVMRQRLLTAPVLPLLLQLALPEAKRSVARCLRDCWGTKTSRKNNTVFAAAQYCKRSI